MAVAAEPLGIVEDMRNPSYILTVLLLAMICAVNGQSLTGPRQSFVSPQLVSTLDGAILLAPDGSLWLWGGNHRQNLDPGCLGTTEVTDVPERFGSEHDWRGVAADFMHALAFKADGSLWAWGRNYSGQLARPASTDLVPTPIQIGSETDWAQISVGAGHCLALKTNGSLWAWGQNDCGQVGDGTTNNAFSPKMISSANDWTAIVAGAFSSYALKRDHSLWGWGGGDFKRHQEFTIGRAHQGSPPCRIDPGTDWVSVSAGDFFVLALKANGTIWIGGRGARSVVRQESIPASGEPLTQVGERSNWAELFAGAGSFFARKSDARFFACGRNACCQLGLDTDREVGSLERVFLDFDPWAFTTGYGNTLLLTKQGKLLTWGKRLGSDRYPRIIQVKQTLNKFIDRFPFRIKPFDTEGFIIDRAPFVLWELPSKVRGPVREGVGK
jgi:alpha-tubulin suppressor-like RCC1 family protein